MDKWRCYPSLEGMLGKMERLSRQDRFRGGDRKAFEMWQAKSAETVAALLGMDKMESCGLKAQVLERVQLEDGIVREKVLIQTEPSVYLPMYILIPPSGGTGRLPCCLALPGHQGAGKYSVAGRYDIEAVAGSIQRYNYDYGLQLAKLGCVAVCPDCRGFGERRETPPEGDEELLRGTCAQLAHMASLIGETVIGMHVWDIRRVIDYLYERDEWDMDNLGCIGFSGGGMQCLWAGTLEPRIRKAVISGYLYGYRDSLGILNSNCACNYVPHVLEHFDMGDLAGMFAPRPLLIQSAREDHLNGPRGLRNVQEQMDIVRAAYRLFGAEDRLRHDIREGGHRWHGEILSDFLGWQ